MLLAVCKRGHLVNSRKKGETATTPATFAQFCPDCSAPVIRKCESCSYPVEWREHYHATAPRYMWEKEIPDSCTKCNAPYPWASREKRIQALYNLIDFGDELDEAEKFEVFAQLAVLSQPEEGDVADAKKIEAGKRLKQLAPKIVELGKDVLGELLADVVWKGMNR